MAIKNINQSVKIIGASTALEVAGTYGDLKIGDPSLGTQITYYSTTRILMNSQDIKFYTNNLTERIRLTSGGNLGIGTTNPDNKLMIESSTDSMLRFTRTGVRSWRQNIGSTGNFIIRDLSGTPADRLTIDTTGKVGIGTTSPTSKLSVTTSNNNDGFRLNYPSTNSTQYPFYIGTSSDSNYVRVNASTIALKRNGAASTIKTEGSSNDLILQSQRNLIFNTSDANERLRILSNGNVLIATTVDSGAKMTVEGDVKLRRPGNDDMFLTFNPYYSALGTSYQWNLVGTNSANNYQFQIREGSTTYLSIGNSAGGNAGYIGIGTTSPTARITLADHTTAAGGIKFRSAASTVSLYSSGSGNLMCAADFNSAGRIRLPGGNAASDPDFGFSAASAGTGFSRSGQHIAFISGGSEKMRLESGGNVGIGTTGPGTKLEVVDSTKAQLEVSGYSVETSTANAANGTIFIGNNASYRGVIDYNASSSSDLIISNTYNNAGNGIRFKVATSDAGGITAMKIMGDGKVGIGTTSPSEKLEVNGIVKVVHTDNSYAKYRGQGVFFNRATSYLAPEADNYGTLNIGYNGARWGNVLINGAFVKFSNGATESMRLTSAGNLGIGTSSPSAKLEVKGTGASTGLTFKTTDSSGNTGFWVQDGGAVGVHYYPFLVNHDYNDAKPSNTLFYAKTSVGSAGGLFVKDSGNVGIGTTLPSKPLNVVSAYSAGTITTSLKLATVGGYNGGSGTALEFGQDQGNYATWVSGKISSPRTGSNYGGSLAFITNRNSSATDIVEAMRIDNFGNVGIGTTAPDAKIKIIQSGSGTNNTIITQDSARKIWIGRDSIKATDLNNNAAMLYLQQNDGNATFGGQLTVDGSINTPSAFNFTGNYGYIKTGTAWNTGVLNFLNGPTTYLQFDVPNGRIKNNLGKYLTASGGVAQFGSIDNYDVAFVSNNVEKMRLSSAGRLGIGTTSPISQFTIANDIGGLGVVGMNYNSGLNSERGNLFYDTDGTGYKFHIGKVQSSAFTPQMTFVDSGNVGIGTATPSTKLTIIDGNTTTLTLNRNDTETTYFTSLSNFYDSSLGTALKSGTYNILTHGTSLGTAVNFTNGALKFNFRDVEKARISDGGNFGIGTTGPDSLLEIESWPAQQTQTRMFHVDNNPANNQGSGYVEISSGTSSQAKTQIETVSSGGYGLLGNNYLDTAIINRGLSNNTYGNIVFATGSSTSAASIVMTIGGGSQKGSVGIGTTTPDDKLHVVGNIRTTGQVKAATLLTDTVEIKEDDPTGALVTFTGQGSAAGGEANVGLKLVGTTATNGTIKLKMKAKNSSGTLTGSGTISYSGQFDTMGIGQSTTHNSMAMLINNDSNVAIGTSTFASNVRLNVGGTVRLLSGGFQAPYAGGFLIADSGSSNRYGLKFGNAGGVGNSNLLMLTNRSLYSASGGGTVAIGGNRATSGSLVEFEIARFDPRATAASGTQSMVTLDSVLKLTKQATPADPPDETSVIWLDENGDLKIKISMTEGGTVTRTIAQYEA